VLFHPATLHGGAGTVAGALRRTLSMVYFGADAWYEARPEVKAGEGELAGDKLDAVSGDPFDGQKEGDAFRPSYAIKLRPAKSDAKAA
jgi:hypothetical protein